MIDSILVGVVIAVAVAVSFWLTVGLSNVFDGISRWRGNRYAKKMGYPTLLDVAKRMDAHIPQLDVDDSIEDSDTQFAMAEKGVAHPLTFELEGREALYDDTLRYAVWERADVAALHAKLGKILDGSQKDGS